MYVSFNVYIYTNFIYVYNSINIYIIYSNIIVLLIVISKAQNYFTSNDYTS